MHVPLAKIKEKIVKASHALYLRIAKPGL